MLDTYQLKAGESGYQYVFTSEGIQGRIHKVIQFTQYENEPFFNLAFGDADENGDFNDSVISNNGDAQKILATIVTAVYAFTKTYPDAWVFAAGSSDSRTRLYRISISIHLALAERDFEIYGRINESWEIFTKNTNYEAFLFKRKIVSFEV